MGTAPEESLSRREREIMDIVYAHGEVSASQIRVELTEAPSYSAVRGLVRVLVEKGHVRARREGVRNLYRPARARRSAGRSAMKRALETFFGGDVEAAMMALVDVSEAPLSKKDLKELQRMIERSRKEGR